MADVNIRRDESLLCGRLVALPPAASTMTELQENRNTQWGFRNTISVDFPAMPDTIELARTAEYAVNSNLVVPDGIHVYKGTKPLEIPISFRLHSLDQQYCKKGALTLLQLSARLHSFVLPISTFNKGFTLAPQALTSPEPVKGKKTSAEVQKVAQGDVVYKVTEAGNSASGGIYAPVTCWLNLMWIGNDEPGISAVGYVREVAVKFNGPWLRGPKDSFNLPTSADFSFVFIHRPGHGNAQRYIDSQFPATTAESGQTFADDVKNKLYNTRALVYSAQSPGYKGFSSNTNNTTTD